MEMYDKLSGILADIIGFIKSFAGELKGFIDSINNDYKIEDDE